jgi:hypothetical protein
LSQGRVAEWFRSLLYRPSSAARLPWLIDRASKGDWDPIVKGILEDARDADHDLSLGLLLSITCSDDLAFVRQEEVKNRGASCITGHAVCLFPSTWVLGKSDFRGEF